MIERAQLGEKQALLDLFDQCFPGEQAFGRWFFGALWRPENTLVLRQQGQIVAMLQLLPMEIAGAGDPLQAEYIYAVGTHPQHRGKGLAAQLLEGARQEAPARGVQCLLLVPQEPSLFGYYARFGYEGCFALEQSQVAARPLPPDCKLRLASAQDLHQMNRLYEKALAGRPHLLRTPSHWENQLALYGEETWLLTRNGRPQAYAFAEQVAGKWQLAEAAGPQCTELAGALLRQKGQESGLCRHPGTGAPGPDTRPFAMALPLSPEANTLLGAGGAYCNLLYN